MKTLIPAILIILVFISCDKKSEYLELNKSIDLAYGKCVKDNACTLSVCFVSVLTDSRCPEGVECFWEGEAIARFKIQVRKYVAQSINLKLSNDTTIHGYKFSFVSLTPYPSISHSINLKDYKANIIVSQ
jgi:hypothetical protein